MPLRYGCYPMRQTSSYKKMSAKNARVLFKLSNKKSSTNAYRAETSGIRCITHVVL
jgi:hypothetical protein